MIRFRRSRSAVNSSSCGAPPIAAFAAQFGWKGAREMRQREETSVTPWDPKLI
jgi:hypothetical protein